MIRYVWKDTTTWSNLSRRERAGGAFEFVQKRRLEVKNIVCGRPYFPKMATLIYIPNIHALFTKWTRKSLHWQEGSILTSPSTCLGNCLNQQNAMKEGRRTLEAMSPGQHGYLLALLWDIHFLSPESPFKKFSYLEITILKSFLATEMPKSPSCLIFLSLGVKHWMNGPPDNHSPHTTPSQAVTSHPHCALSAFLTHRNWEREHMISGFKSLSFRVIC